MGNRNEPLGELEQAVMDCLWDEGELGTPGAFEKVGVARGLAYTTVLTVLQRLTKKGLLLRRAQGRGHLYRPALSRDEFTGREAERLASRLHVLGAVGVAAFLAEADRLDGGLVEQLRRQLDTLK